MFLHLAPQGAVQGVLNQVLVVLFLYFRAITGLVHLGNGAPIALQPDMSGHVWDRPKSQHPFIV